jgi:hypothetical protein
LPGQRLSGNVLRAAARRRWPVREPDAPAEPVDAAHREELEALMDLLRITIELESPTDYGDPPDTGSGVRGDRNRAAFLAHFAELKRPLRRWDDTVESVLSAPGALWEWFARSTGRRGISEPPYAVGPLIDRLAILTIERARHGRLGVPHTLYIQRFADRSDGEVLVSLYVEGQNVARLPGEQVPGAEHVIQALFDEAQKCRQAGEIVEARDSLLAIKQPLLDVLAVHASLDEIAFAADCPICQAAPRD